MFTGYDSDKIFYVKTSKVQEPEADLMTCNSLMSNILCLNN